MSDRPPIIIMFLTAATCWFRLYGITVLQTLVYYQRSSAQDRWLMKTVVRSKSSPAFDNG